MPRYDAAWWARRQPTGCALLALAVLLLLALGYTAGAVWGG